MMVESFAEDDVCGNNGILIIGGGLIGLSTAYHLAGQIDGIVLIDPAHEVGHGASHANGGMVTPALSEPWNSPGAHRRMASALLGLDPSMRVRWAHVPALWSWAGRFLRHCTTARCDRATAASFRLARFSALELARASANLGLDAAWRYGGTLALFHDVRALDAQERVSGRFRSDGLNFETLSPAALIAREPLLAAHERRLAGGLWFPDDQSADSAQLCCALAAAIVARGGAIRLGIGARALRHDRGGIAVLLSDGRELRPAHTIVAAGVHSPALVRGLGIKLPVAPAKGYSLTIDLGGEAVRPRSAIYDHAAHTVYTALGEVLRVAGTAEFAGFDTTLTAEPLERMLAATRTLLPTLSLPSTLGAARPWAGLRPVSADGLPYIGSSGISGLWLNAGHGALGLTHAMGSGALLADLIMQRPPRLDPAPYRVIGRP